MNKTTAKERVKFVSFDRTILNKSFIWLTTEPLKTLTASSSFTKEQQLEWFERLDTQKDYFVQGVLYDETPVGVWGLKHITTDSAEYFGYIGESEYWRKGIGSEIMEESIRKANQLGLKEINLRVWEKNLPAIHLYEKYNFQIVNKQNDMYCMRLKI